MCPGACRSQLGNRISTGTVTNCREVTVSPHHLRPLEDKNWLCEGEASQRFPRGTQQKET